MSQQDRKEYLAAYRAANAERIKQRNAKYRAANAEKIKAYNEAYAKRINPVRRAKYRANPEPTKAKAREYNRRNAERNRQKSKQWRETNPERYRQHVRLGQQRRRARLADLPVYILTPKDLRRLVNGDCAVTSCDRRDIHIDHVIPIARGGSHGVGNFQSLCSFHNSMKGSKLWIEFRAYLAAKAALAA